MRDTDQIGRAVNRRSKANTSNIERWGRTLSRCCAAGPIRCENCPWHPDRKGGCQYDGTGDPDAPAVLAGQPEALPSLEECAQMTRALEAQAQARQVSSVMEAILEEAKAGTVESFASRIDDLNARICLFKENARSIIVNRK